MAKYEFIKGTQEHADEVVEVMREIDKTETWTFARLTPTEAMDNLLSGSRDTLTVLADGEILFMYGSIRVHALSGEGYPWLLATPRIKDHSRVFVRNIKAFLNAMLEHYEVLVNYGDAQNETSHRWMTWLGFTVAATELRGSESSPHYRYELRRPV